MDIELRKGLQDLVKAYLILDRKLNIAVKALIELMETEAKDKAREAIQKIMEVK